MSDEKEQITINVRSDVAEYIRQESTRIGGSNQYMGEIIENLVDGRQTNQGAILERLDEIEAKLNEDSPRNTSTHTTSGSSIPEEIHTKLENEEEIDPEEHDLDQLKGSGKVLEVTELVVKSENGMTEEEIKELFSAIFGYSVNSIRQKKNSLINRLDIIPPVDEETIIGWLNDEINQGWHKRSQTNDRMISPHMNVEEPKVWYREEHGGDLNSYLHLSRHGTEIKTEYVHPDNLELKIDILRSRLEHIADAETNQLVEQRVNRVLSYLN